MTDEIVITSDTQTAYDLRHAAAQLRESARHLGDSVGTAEYRTLTRLADRLEALADRVTVTIDPKRISAEGRDRALAARARGGN